MTPDQLFDFVENELQRKINLNEGDEIHVYSEREMRGTFPTLAIRVIPAPRDKKPKAGAKVISRQMEWIAPTEVPIPPGAGS